MEFLRPQVIRRINSRNYVLKINFAASPPQPQGFGLLSDMISPLLLYYFIEFRLSKNIKVVIPLYTELFSDYVNG